MAFYLKKKTKQKHKTNHTLTPTHKHTQLSEKLSYFPKLPNTVAVMKI